MNKTPEQLKEVFEWYIERVLHDTTKTIQQSEEMVFNLLDNLKAKALQDVISQYEFNKK